VPEYAIIDKPSTLMICLECSKKTILLRKKGEKWWWALQDLNL
jgi:hypothetical protein